MIQRQRNNNIIGSGTYGKVYLSKVNGVNIATKKFEVSTEGIQQDVARELHAVHLMKGLNQIVEILKVNSFVNDLGETIVSIEMKYHTGDLHKFITSVPITERIKYGVFVISQLLDGLYALLERGIIHRDIKPENILVDYQYNTIENKLISQPRCVIADFGLSRQLQCTHQDDETKMTAKVYTGWYRPPELLESTDDKVFYSFNADVWAMGATIAEYYAGKPLYPSENLSRAKMLALIKQSAFETNDGLTVDLMKFYRQNINHYHFERIDLRIIKATQRMLILDPTKRPTINQLIESPIKIPKAIVPLSRGTLTVSNAAYQESIQLIIKTCISYRMEIMTIINAIGLYERYLSHFKTNKVDLVTIVAISLAALINELHPLTISDYRQMILKDYLIQEIKVFQVEMAEKLKYCFSTCETDVFYEKIMDQPKPYKALDITYQGLFQDHKEPQKLTYDDLAAAVTKYNR